MNQIRAKTFGLVVQQYTTPDQDIIKDKLDTLPYTLEQVLEVVTEQVERAFNVEVKQWVIARERGTKKDREHFQCFIGVSKVITTREQQQLIVTDKGLPCPLLMLFQKARNTAALIKYCKKDGDFIMHLEGTNKNDFMVKHFADMPTSEALKKIIDEKPELVVTGDLTRIMRNLDVQRTLDTAVPESFEKVFPGWLEYRPECMLLKAWFDQQFLPEGSHRREALVLFSKERALGKTTFAKSLVGMDPRRYIICRNTFTQQDFNKPFAQLLILDDMTFLDKHKEMWKALLSSEATSIREAYMNMHWKGGLPVIVTTNNIGLMRHLMTSEYYKNDCWFFVVEDYLGPTGTDPKTHRRAFRGNMTLEKFNAKFGLPAPLLNEQFEGFSCNSELGLMKMWKEPKAQTGVFNRCNELGWKYADLKRSAQEELSCEAEKKKKPMFIGAINEL